MPTPTHSSEPEWLHGHPHEPNPSPPSADATLTLVLPDGTGHAVDLEALAQLPQTQVADCYIMSTGHASSGPFTFGGVRLADLVQTYVPGDLKWTALDVISGDGFGNRVTARELLNMSDAPLLLATHVDGIPLTRAAGLVRLIVPSETDDALRQVKWVARILIHA